MRARAVWILAMMGFAGVVFAAALLGWAQYPPAGNGVTIQNLPNGRSQSGFGDNPQLDPVLAQKRLRALNAERQKTMVSDTDKLVKLARQLDAEIASNSTEDLTSEELRKVAEIEKLARSVKEKMAQSFGGGPQFRMPSIPLGGPPLQ